MRSRTVRPLRRRDQGAGARQNGYGHSGSHAQVRQERRNTQPVLYADHSYGMQHSVYAVPREGERYPEEEKDGRKKRGILSRILVTDAQYFDYDLLLVIIFLMCLGLIMLYSTSSYENGTYYFSRQALFGDASFAVMLFVSKIDYHIYGAFSFECYLLAQERSCVGYKGR